MVCRRRALAGRRTDLARALLRSIDTKDGPPDAARAWLAALERRWADVVDLADEIKGADRISDDVIRLRALAAAHVEADAEPARAP